MGRRSDRRGSPLLNTKLQGSLYGDFLDEPAFGDHRLFLRLKVERNGLPDVPPGLFEGIAFGNATRQSGDIDGVTAFFRRFEQDFQLHGKSLGGGRHGGGL